MNKLIQPPAGLSDAEESEWWYANRAIVEQELIDAMREGRVRRGRLVPPSQKTVTTAIQLDPADAKKATALAEKKGVSTETFLQTLVHLGLEREQSSADAA